MKIAVIAANGRSGQAFVKEALMAGHSVHAGSLTVGTLPPHPNLVEVVCDATKEADLIKLITGQDAVASFIGHVKGSAPDVQTKAIEKVVTVMESLGVSRITSLTGTGCRFEGDKITVIDRFLNAAVSIIDPNRIKDGLRHVEVLKQSQLEWTIIRVLKLQNVSASSFVLREHGPTKVYVSRDDVAVAVLEVLENHSFVRQAPIISSK